eukprot:9498055-Alexandrium_andersonii.AAC.1
MRARCMCNSLSNRIARVRARGVHSCAVVRSCPSARVLGADGAIVEHCAAHWACFGVNSLMYVSQTDAVLHMPAASQTCAFS